ncbi:MAG TPA: hypothetical protein VL860_03300, partial [Planctomycetota bacterium]|nr:hypothetical protein [Planctomycetota bacterium]
MNTTSEPAPGQPGALVLGIDGFTWADLHKPARLADLDQRFLKTLEHDDPSLGARFRAWRNGAPLGKIDESNLLVAAAAHLSAFVTTLFGIENEAAALAGPLDPWRKIMRMKKEFIQRRVAKKPAAAAAPATPAAPALSPATAERELFDCCRKLQLPAARLQAIDGTAAWERPLAEAVCDLLDIVKPLKTVPATAAVTP